MADAFVWRGDLLKAVAEVGAAQGVHRAAEHVLGEARKVVPLDEATLSRSGATDVDESTTTASAYFDTPYAVRQHEDMTLRHSRGRRAKYLEGPLTESRDKQLKIIRDAVADAIRDAVPEA